MSEGKIKGVNEYYIIDRIRKECFRAISNQLLAIKTN